VEKSTWELWEYKVEFLEILVKRIPQRIPIIKKEIIKSGW
jgi:hypothetical protein